MGASQSTNRAAKFSGTRRRVRSCNSAPPTAPLVRRQPSQRNTNRNVKEFSKFWSGAVEPLRKSSRASTPQPTPYQTPRPPRNLCTTDNYLTPRRSEYSAPSPCYEDLDDDVIVRPYSEQASDNRSERLHALRFPHETAIY
ncbi:unnamed protein product [Heligmosomoides polygyrus]|uniref:Uncharacterized protein n=1 Tax=Heligmosomoides polygyrus TaxID=6339 RepID=A0A183GQG0_HELPZ|nr:unnamed protein product [Heligmosomoides polygyrus]